MHLRAIRAAHGARDSCRERHNRDVPGVPLQTVTPGRRSEVGKPPAAPRSDAQAAERCPPRCEQTSSTSGCELFSLSSKPANQRATFQPPKAPVKAREAASLAPGSVAAAQRKLSRHPGGSIKPF